MRQKTEATKRSAERVIKDIRRVTRKQYGAEEKIRIVLEGLRGEESIAALCRREGIAESLYTGSPSLAAFDDPSRRSSLRLAARLRRAPPQSPEVAVPARRPSTAWQTGEPRHSYSPSEPQSLGP